MNKKGAIIVISAPSGTGKTTIIKNILKDFPSLVFSVSATTRRKRDNEADGIDYFFLSDEEFKKKIDRNEFIEWEEVYGYRYGTLKSFIEENISKGKPVILELEVKGALSIKKIYKDAFLIFISPPNFEELVNRLKKRQTESYEELNKRIERAKMELSMMNKFDYFVENKDLSKAVSEVKSLIKNIIKE
ncbi:MAG TPA: guanylate kinase [Ignavibacteriaceae bacterium]|nr:guanylate kinase [Ignavibacteriaceae bacterium]